MLFHEVVDLSGRVGATRGRLEKTRLIAELLTRVHQEEIGSAVSFLSGKLTQGRIGVGWTVVARARDIGSAAQPTLSLNDVDAAFDRLHRLKGAGTARTRAGVLQDLFSRATDREQDFLIRLISGELRQGALEGVLAEAIAKAAGVPADSIRQAAMLCGDLADVARTALLHGAASLSQYTIQLFRPVEPMLASPAEGVADALECFGEAAFELKLDGARIQAHKDGAEVRVFSRALREVTAAVPEVVERMQSVDANSVILDGEVIALQPNGAPRPFQETMRRFGRRLDVERLRAELPLTPVFFDCLYVDGQPVIAAPQRERYAMVVRAAGDLAVRSSVIGDEVAATQFFDVAIAAGHEGVMAKALDAPYVAGSRGRTWLKIKSVRTLDLVVLAAEWGSGRRRGWLSNLHLGARDPERNRFVMLGKTFKGMTDELLEWQTAALLERETAREGHIVHVRPELVVEVAFNDLQESPQYPGGLALRFARIKGYRADKSAREADTLQTLQNIYRATTGRDAPMPRAPDA